MRKLSANVKQVLARDDVALIHLVKIEMQKNALNQGIPNALIDTEHERVTVFETTSPYSVVFNGNTYNSSSGLMSVEAPRLSQVVDRESYKLVYNDPMFDKVGLLDGALNSKGQVSVMTGAKVTVYISFINPYNFQFGGAAPGQALLDVNDVLVAYKGIVDTQGYTINPNDGTAIAVLECSSPVASLGLVKSLYTSKESLKKFVGASANDTAFDQVYIGAEGIPLLWGKG